LEVASSKFYAISPNTPLGLLLMSKMVGDTVAFRANEFTIIEVL
jgi:transcription elongation GreA/GreB family factor